MLTLHIAAGLLSLLAGATALCATKGSTLHRRAGLLFVVAMFAMTSSAIVIAAFLRPNTVNIMVGTLTLYLVSSSLLTVKPLRRHATGVHVGLMLMALAALATALALALSGSIEEIDSVPAEPLYMFATVAVLGVLGDARQLMFGSLQGRRRLARHLWRMTFALWIATASFFLGQAKFFPQSIRSSGVLAVPVLVVLLAMIYWLWKMRRRSQRATAANAVLSRQASVEPSP